MLPWHPVFLVASLLGCLHLQIPYEHISLLLTCMNLDSLSSSVATNKDSWMQKAVDSKLGRLEGFIKRVKIPIQVFVACGIEGTGDPFRKPKPGMWRLMEQHFNSGIAVDMEQLCIE
eukprot:Gb_29459 [translate_table: standard]